MEIYEEAMDEFDKVMSLIPGKPNEKALIYYLGFVHRNNIGVKGYCSDLAGDTTELATRNKFVKCLTERMEKCDVNVNELGTRIQEIMR